MNAPDMGGNPKCIDAIPMYWAQVYSDVILDLLILIIPIPLVLTAIEAEIGCLGNLPPGRNVFFLESRG